jgi:NAD(P)-dependent dehydrogenase (short-subunit alcohol dehydrogenase family)
MWTRRTRSLTGKVAFVTGAAQGVGFATARALARSGVTVALADLDGAKVAAAAEAVGRSAVGLPLDVTDHTAYAAALDEAERRLGPIDILINNAGIMPLGPFERESDATARQVIDVNFHAMLFGSKQAVRRFKSRRSAGHIVNVASGAGWIPGGGAVTYGGSKFAVVGFSQALAWELHGSGINVSVVAPAVIRTQLGAGLADVRGLRKVDPDDVGAAIVDALQKPRFAIWVPREMGALALTMSALPYRARGWLARATNADRLLLQADGAARAAYEEGIASQAAAAAFELT